MRKADQVRALAARLAQLYNNSPRFRTVFPGEGAQQFALGIAAGLDWARGRDVRPLNELVEWLDLSDPLTDEQVRAALKEAMVRHGNYARKND